MVKKYLSVSQFNKLTYRLGVAAKQHQARLGDDAGSAGPRDLQGLTVRWGAVIHQSGAVESHFLQEERHKIAQR